MWNQKKAININECKTIADLFRVGCTWEKRIKKLKECHSRKAEKLTQELNRRLDKIYDYVHTNCGNDVVMTPRWYVERQLKPLTEAMKKIKIENA